MTVAEPGTHGAGVTGTQGIGVNTPNAPAVAAATVGFASEVHIPKGIILTNGILSIIFAAGTLLVIVVLVGNTTKELGATPKLHIKVAPMQTCIAIVFNLYSQVHKVGWATASLPNISAIIPHNYHRNN
jgi:hypothetical protein